MDRASKQERETEPKLKRFNNENKNIPILVDYTEELGEEYWEDKLGEEAIRKYGKFHLRPSFPVNLEQNNLMTIFRNCRHSTI